MIRILCCLGLSAALASLLLCSPRGSLAVDEKALHSPADWAKMQPIRPRGYVCCRANKPPVLDGKLDDADWSAAPWSAPFMDIEGEAKPKPKEPLKNNFGVSSGAGILKASGCWNVNV